MTDEMLFFSRSVIEMIIFSQ